MARSIARAIHIASERTPGPFLKDELIFPRRWATHSCTAWAVRTVLAFAESFEHHGQLPSKYGAWPEKLSP
jgi:hypothetical protein